jgi:LysR family transcriptional regulator, low CO2-responsive transcriptional regulator
VAKYQHFSKAAEVLHISQPAVSVHIKILSDILVYHSLFERVGRRVQTTEAGQLVDSYVRRLLAVACELEQAVAEYKGVLPGS